jgi:DNA polymerase III sliding clamp (beta) subunit (PCNA family)
MGNMRPLWKAGSMISSITFETSTIADVIKKAEKIAPSKGAAFDKAAGIVIEFDPTKGVPLAIVRATNLEIFSMEWTNVVGMDGEAAQWRLPSGLLAMVIGALPIGSGKEVKLTSEVSGHNFIINLTSGRTKAKFHPIDMSYYPLWGAFEPDSMYPAPNLGGRIGQVEWAAAKSDAALAGVYLDGEYALATDKYRLARVPLPIPDLPNPIVVPAGLLGQVLKATGDIQVGSTGQMLHIMPDESTQMKTVLYDVQYPRVTKITDMEFDTHVKLSRDGMVQMINRVDAFSLGDRQAALEIYLGQQELAFYMKNEGMGNIGDVLEVPGQADHRRFLVKFTARNLLDALSHSPNDLITMSYVAGAKRGMFRIDDGAGYQAWVVGRVGESE